MKIRVINDDGSIQWEKEVVVSVTPPVTPPIPPIIPPVVPPVAPPSDPSVVALTGFAPGGKNFGGIGVVTKVGEVKKYSITLKDGLDALPGVFAREVAIPKGSLYREFEINIVDRSQVGELKITVTNPKGVEYLFRPPSQGLSYFKFQNQIPPSPGRYILSVQLVSGGPTEFWVSWGSKPSMVQSELTK